MIPGSYYKYLFCNYKMCSKSCSRKTEKVPLEVISEFADNNMTGYGRRIGFQFT